MENKKVKVLVSTYNGEKYIIQQLDSILNQTYNNIEIYVRDDGSKDNTKSILKDYELKNLINLDDGRNIGFIKSFFSLIEKCGDADYFAFCDQDDVWLPEKIEMALSKLEKRDSRKPLLYFSDYDFYDSELKYIKRVESYKRPASFQNALVDCMSLGFNSVFNRSARDRMVKDLPQNSCGHDWWTYLICIGLGEVIYDKRVTVKYRRHGSNVSAGGMKFIKFQIWRFKKFFLNNYFENVKVQLREYESLYCNELSKENIKILRLFTKETYDLKNVLRKVFYPHFFRQGIVDEMLIRIMFLFGKL